MTREELKQAHEERLAIWCRGARFVTMEQRYAAENLCQTLLKEGDITGVEKLIRDLNDAVGGGIEVPAPGSPEADYFLAVVRVLDTRKGCGQSLKEIVVEGPWDGKEHIVPCPKCGIDFRWTPALSDEDAKEQEEKQKADITAVLGV